MEIDRSTSGEETTLLGPQRALAAFVMIALGAVVVRLFALGRVPSPAGDEGTWVLLAARLSRGITAGLPPEAGFVSLAFAHAMSASMRVFGESFFAARLVGAAATLTAGVVAYRLFASERMHTQGLVVAAVVLFHPWSVAWSRTASVPYSLALATMTIGGFCFLSGIRTKSARRVAFGVFVVLLGAQFSPLMGITGVGVAAAALRRPNRWIFRNPLCLGAAALGIALTVPVILGALQAATSTASIASSESLIARTRDYIAAVAECVAGTATLRHFSPGALEPFPRVVFAGLTLSLCAAATIRSISDDNTALRTASAWLMSSIALVPIVLATGREWHFPTIDTERYGFVFIPAFAWVVAEFVASRRRLDRLLGALVGLGLIATTATLASRSLASGGPDLGASFRVGGAYRGWRASSDRTSTVEAIARSVLADAGPRTGTVVLSDWAFHPLRFVLDRTRIRVRNIRSVAMNPEPLGEPVYIVLWSDAMFAHELSPHDAARENSALRAWMTRIGTDQRLVGRQFQPDGSALLEVWAFRVPGAASAAAPRDLREGSVDMR